MTHPAPHRAVEELWRTESAKLIAFLFRLVRDIDLAEDLAQDALVVALKRWPETGVPDNPAAWLRTTAKRRAIDLARRNQRRDRKYDEIARQLQGFQESEFDWALSEIKDDLLRLIFMTCHPGLSQESRVALTLRLLCGLSTNEIAHAFMVQESTIAQRIVRAKKTLKTSGVPFEVPIGGELAERLPSVLEVIYLAFNEGYAATSGEVWIRPMLCDEALRLGELLVDLLPHDSEVHGLVALMALQASRFRARVDASGNLILLLDQDRTRWDQPLIARGLEALNCAEAVGGPAGPYRLQAEIAACHARAKTADDTDWSFIAELYDRLARVLPTPVVELNRAVAVSMAKGPFAGLEIVDQLRFEPSLQAYHWLPSVRGDLLAKLGRWEEAANEFRRAASLTRNSVERTYLLRRADGQEENRSPN